MTLLAIAALALLGLVTGFVSGLVGIGGGVLIVPFLYFLYAHPAFAGVTVAHDLHAAVAHATSLFIIVPTAVSGVWTYHKLGAVAWRVAVPVALVSVLGAVGGSRIAPLLQPEWLKLAFGAFLLFTAGNMVLGRRKAVPGEVRATPAAALLTGSLVGLLSALLGVGGGIVAIPLLLRLMHVKVEQVAATSLAIVVVAAASGALSYMAAAPPAAMPAGHLGYVHIVAALPILLAAALTAGWGAKVNQKLDPRKLRWTFAALFAALGVQLIVQNISVAWS